MNVHACIHCGQPCYWVDCPTGGWWAHVQHPQDDHDADFNFGAPIAEAGEC